MRGAGRLGSLLLLALAGGCFTARLYTPRPGPYDRVPDAWWPRLERAREAFEEGDLAAALDLLQGLRREDPRVLPVRVFLQEIELALLERGEPVGALRVREPAQARSWLADEYLGEAEANPTAEAYLLAARLAAEPTTALQLIDQAERLDPQCVWVHYARAWWHFAAFRFTPAEEALRRAFRIDPGHLPAMRLESILLTAAGEASRAIGVLELWRRRTEEDPLVSAEVRGEALLDLASLEVLAGRPKRALAHLEEVDPRAVEHLARLEEVRAAAHDARGEFELAYEAVRRARELDPTDPLPIVQEAMLEARLGDTEGELERWRELLEHLEAHPATGFQAFLFRLQAQVRLARAARAAGAVVP